MTTSSLKLPTAAAAVRTIDVRAIGQRLMNLMITLGHANAAASMRRLAVVYGGTRPELARQLREAANRGPIY